MLSPVIIIILNLDSCNFSIYLAVSCFKGDSHIKNPAKIKSVSAYSLL